MRLPSGDQAGSRSATAGLLVRLRMSPFSAGTVTISPWISKTARAPVGEMLAFRMRLASSFSKCGRNLGKLAGKAHVDRASPVLT